MPKKILFFTESLRAGGKERRMIELLHYFKNKTDYAMHVVTTEEEVHYKYFYDLNIPLTILKRKWLKKDPAMFVRFYRIAKQFNPDIIHTWGTMTTFYAIPSKIILRRALLANLIANAKSDFNSYSLSNLFFKSSCYYSDSIIGNSSAGFLAYGIKSKKRCLIYNGARLERFEINADKNAVKKSIGVNTKYIVIMVASMADNKDYDLFLDIAKNVQSINKDVAFVAVGDGPNFHRIQKRRDEENIKNAILLGKRNDAETLIYASDIGILCTYSEGISNSILEYMALGKPVIATDINGGSKEIIEDGESGFIMTNNVEQICNKINILLNNEVVRKQLGNKGRDVIEKRFTIERMGREYLKLYESIAKQ